MKSYKRGAILYFDPVEALRKQHDEQARKAGLKEPRDIALLAAIGTPLGGMQMKQVPYVYHLNKLLFYQWVKMDEEGLGEAFPHDHFLQERKGPVPQHIWEDLERLEKDGLVRVRYPGGTEHKPVPVELTPKGQELVNTLLQGLDTDFVELTATQKTAILPLSPAKLMEKVHREYPAYKREYVEVDDA